MKKSLFVIVLITVAFFSVNMRAGVLDTVAEYVHDHPQKWNHEAAVKIVNDYAQANDIASKKFAAPPEPTKFENPDEFDVFIGRMSGGTLLAGMVVAGVAGIAEGMVLLGLALIATPGIFVLGLGVIFGIGAIYSKKFRENKAYYTRLLRGFGALRDDASAQASVMDKLKSIHAINVKIKKTGSSLVLKVKRTAIKYKIRKELSELRKRQQQESILGLAPTRAARMRTSA